MPPPTTQVTVDPYTLAVVKLTMFRDDIELSVGSGFLWRWGGGLCIVTAWHCLTGAHYETRQSLSPTGARPNRVRATFLSARGGTTHDYHLNLRTIDDAPAWVVHPLGSTAVDLAVIPVSIDLPAEVINRPVNDLDQQPIRVEVGSELFIVGFPLGISRLNLPIWKRASLAIEPGALIDEAGGRYLIVDSATREGMSGAPVFARSIGSYIHENGNMNVVGGTSTKFVGIYTGRLSTRDPMGAQLGIVWPAPLLDQLLAQGVSEDFA